MCWRSNREPHAAMSDAEFDAACLAMADFADLKSPYSVGHSRAVAALAAEAARRCGLPEADAQSIWRAPGCLHDIGQVAVPARIWLKPAALNDSEWEQVRLHPYYGERVLARPAALARLGALAAQHHERLDGSGYHRGARANALTPAGQDSGGRRSLPEQDRAAAASRGAGGGGGRGGAQERRARWTA